MAVNVEAAPAYRADWRNGRVASWLTTVGADDRNGRSCRSPTPYPSKPSSSARTA